MTAQKAQETSGGMSTAPRGSGTSSDRSDPSPTEYRLRVHYPGPRQKAVWSDWCPMVVSGHRMKAIEAVLDYHGQKATVTVTGATDPAGSGYPLTFQYRRTR